MGSTPKAPVPSILSKDQLVTDNEDEEIYILRVPNTLTSSSIMSLDMNLKSPNRIIVQDKEFSPIVAKDVETKSVLGQIKKDKYSPTVLKLKGIVTLRESVKVPAIPKVEIPQPYKVPHPQNLVSRHPIYGRLDIGSKRKVEESVENFGDNVHSSSKKKKKSEAVDIVPTTKEEDVVETPFPKKKKKKDKVKCEEELEVKEEVDDTQTPVAKKKKKKDKK